MAESERAGGRVVEHVKIATELFRVPLLCEWLWPNIDNVWRTRECSIMAAKTMNISLTPELRTSIDRRLRSGLYGNASDVIRAGLRTLSREEMAVA
jgi:hypothetical protein